MKTRNPSRKGLRRVRLVAAALLSTMAVVHAADAAAGSNRATYTADAHSAGTTVPIPEHVVRRFCADKDGCVVRFWHLDFGHHRHTEAVHALLYYDFHNKRWVTDQGTRGRNDNRRTEHLLQLSTACYLTDGDYSHFHNQGDLSTDFGVLLWERNKPHKKCKVTLID